MQDFTSRRFVQRTSHLSVGCSALRRIVERVREPQLLLFSCSATDHHGTPSRRSILSCEISLHVFRASLTSSYGEDTTTSCLSRLFRQPTRRQSARWELSNSGRNSVVVYTWYCSVFIFAFLINRLGETKIFLKTKSFMSRVLQTASGVLTVATLRIL